MSKQIIEFVCTGNHGRSPVSELIARNHLISIGAISEYDSASSGTLVKQLQDRECPFEAQTRIIRKAQTREDVYGVADSFRIDVFLRHEIDDEAKSNLGIYYDIALNVFRKEELQYRTEAIKEFNIEGRLKEIQEQTIVRPDAVAVLSMSGSNNLAVEKIYNDVKNKPIIQTVGYFATDNPKIEIPNAFGGTKEQYFECIQILMELVPKAVEKVVNSK